MNAPYRSLQEEFVFWLHILGFSQAIQTHARLNISLWFDWLENHSLTHITYVKNPHLHQYIHHLQTRPNRVRAGGLSHAYMNKNLWVLDKFIVFLHQNGMRTALTPLGYRFYIDKQAQIERIEVFTQDQIRRLMACIPQVYPDQSTEKRQAKQYLLQAVFALFYACGLRRSEGLSLQISDVDFDRRMLLSARARTTKTVGCP